MNGETAFESVKPTSSQNNAYQHIKHAHNQNASASKERVPEPRSDEGPQPQPDEGGYGEPVTTPTEIRKIGTNFLF